MSSKKDLILYTSRQLFNEKGFYQVTIRMIANQLNMSSGNLNYHFKKREDIFEALYFEMVSEFDKRLIELPQTEISMRQIHQDMLASMQKMVHYTFFWTDLYQLLQISSKVNAHFQEVYIQRIKGCLYLFQQMQSLELLNVFQTEKDSKYLAERMVQYGNTWLYSSKLYDTEIKNEHIAHYANTLLSILTPYFTKKGKQQFDEL